MVADSKGNKWEISNWIALLLLFQEIKRYCVITSETGTCQRSFRWTSQSQNVNIEKKSPTGIWNKWITCW